MLEVSLDVFVKGGSGHQGSATQVINHLGVNVLAAAMNREPGALRRSRHALANTDFAPRHPHGFCFIFIRHVDSTFGGFGYVRRPS